MQEILQQINHIEGVIGSAVFDQKGKVLANRFPALIDTASLETAAGLTLECAFGLQVSDCLDILDMRYAEGRVVVKRFTEAYLFLLCAKNINLQVLTITLNMAVKKLEEILPGYNDETDNTTADSDGLLRLPISHLANKQASASFDSLGMIAISQQTSQLINEFYKGSFKKLTLANSAAGTSGSFPVMVMKDMEEDYDGTIVVGPSIEKKLRVNFGDRIVVTI